MRSSFPCRAQLKTSAVSVSVLQSGSSDVTVKMAKQDIFDYLKTIGCCDVCCLRYFNGRGDDYLNVQKALEMVSNDYLNIAISNSIADNFAERPKDRRVK